LDGHLLLLLMQNEMGRQFDYKSDDFTLERIIEWGFDQYAEKIKDISGAATKELMIETGIADINQTWESLEFDLVAYKDKGHFKLRYVLHLHCI
jgi:dynein heavy chain, axonemal